MKKICHCLKMPHSAYIGGVATIVNNYFDNMQLFEENGYTEVLFDYQNEVVNRIKFSPLQTVVYGIFQQNGLRKKIVLEHIDILHLHTSRSSLFVKDVILGKKIFEKTGVKVVMTIHVGEIDTVFEKVPKFTQKYLIEQMNNCFSQICFMSEKIKEQFIEFGLKRNIAKVLYNFGDMPICLNQPRHEKTLKLLFVGMINRDKGVLELLEAIETLDSANNIQLSICGNITDSSIEELFNKKMQNLTRKVQLLGYVKGDKKADVYSKSDVLVLPSYHEGFPLVILEALAAGCAVIATPVGAIPEVLTNDNCLYVGRGNVEELKEAIKKLDDDRELLLKIQQNNKNLSRKFSKEQHINELCAIYDSLF